MALLLVKVLQSPFVLVEFVHQEAPGRRIRC
jgi:hypothetical protein